MSVRASVFVEIDGDSVLAGELFVHRGRRAESATFSYAAEYLARPGSYELDPALPFTTGPTQTPVGSALFGCFADSAPDRWGRLLAARAERLRAADAGAHPRQLLEIDVLLGVRDDLRQGAIRLATPEGIWLAPGTAGIPYLVDLPTLLGASDAVARDDAQAEELRTLLRAGSSLGGARPKANVVDHDGSIAIAKFPRARDVDRWDVVRWEAVTLELARRAGIRASQSRLVAVGSRDVLLVRRFDRIGARRVGYLSAMTMLEAVDGAHRSYVEIAEVIEERGSDVAVDLEELWRRVVFGVLVSNTDDHLRNHGFLRDDVRVGWRLAPAFDVNPDPEPGNTTLATSIDGESDDASIELAFAVADAFLLTEERASVVLGEVQVAVSQWREVAAAHGCRADEIRRMEAAFT